VLSFAHAVVHRSPSEDNNSLQAGPEDFTMQHSRRPSRRRVVDIAQQFSHSVSQLR